MQRSLALVSTTVASLTAGSAQPANLDRTGQSIAPLFEDGNYAELSFGIVESSISGTLAAPAPPLGSGDMVDPYWQIGGAHKHQVTEAISVAIIHDQPFGADARYPAGGVYPLAGTRATFDSDALTVLGRYVGDLGIGIHGGFRIQKVTASTAVPSVSGYSANSEDDDGVGFVVGASYEIPEIALRVALTYSSEIETEHLTSESSTALGADRLSVTEIVTPQSVNLDFRTGVAPGTLVFGSLRWVEWSDFSIDPDDFRTLAGRPFLSYSEDVITYSLGVGRELGDHWAATLSLTYEPSEGAFITNLGPVNGRFGITLGGRYETERFTVSGAVSYSVLDTARTVVTSGPPVTTSRFSDNDVIGIGFKIGFHY